MLPVWHSHDRGPGSAATGRRAARSRGPVLLAVIVLAVSALVMGQVVTDQVPREVGYGLAVLGLVAIGWHLAQRRG